MTVCVAANEGTRFDSSEDRGDKNSQAALLTRRFNRANYFNVPNPDTNTHAILRSSRVPLYSTIWRPKFKDQWHPYRTFVYFCQAGYVGHESYPPSVRSACVLSLHSSNMPTCRALYPATTGSYLHEALECRPQVYPHSPPSQR